MENTLETYLHNREKKGKEIKMSRGLLRDTKVIKPRSNLRIINAPGENK